MDKLTVSTESKRGTGVKDLGEKGQAILYLNEAYGFNAYICINNFKGHGNDYKQAEHAEIHIRHNGELLIYASMDDFFDSLNRDKCIYQSKDKTE